MGVFLRWGKLLYSVPRLGETYVAVNLRFEGTGGYRNGVLSWQQHEPHIINKALAFRRWTGRGLAMERAVRGALIPDRRLFLVSCCFPNQGQCKPALPARPKA